MQNNTVNLEGKTALITGAAKRVGAEITRALHQAGMDIVVHYRHSAKDADTLCNELNGRRAGSAIGIAADLLQTTETERLIKASFDWHGNLHALVNNASVFYPTRLGGTDEQQWDELFGANLKAPFFLTQAAATYLKLSEGCVVNLIDIYAQRALSKHPVYSASKAGLAMLTKALAKELGPDVRVNGVAPGAILWPDKEMDEQVKKEIIRSTALKRRGTPQDIAKAVLFLVKDADYITGEIITVDGGRSLG